MIRQPRPRHWSMAVLAAVLVHGLAVTGFDPDQPVAPVLDHSPQDVLTIALAPPPATAPVQIETQQIETPKAPKPEPLVSPVKIPEPEPEPEPEVKAPIEQATQTANRVTANPDASVSTGESHSTGESEAEGSASADPSQPTSTGGIQDAEPDYRNEVQAWLEKHKDYPLEARRKGLEGMAMVTFTFDRKGHILDFRLNRETGHPLLDKAIAKMMVQASPLPAMPASADHTRMTWTLPVYFQLN